MEIIKRKFTKNFAAESNGRSRSSNFSQSRPLSKETIIIAKCYLYNDFQIFKDHWIVSLLRKLNSIWFKIKSRQKMESGQWIMNSKMQRKRFCIVWLLVMKKSMICDNLRLKICWRKLNAYESKFMLHLAWNQFGVTYLKMLQPKEPVTED